MKHGLRLVLAAPFLLLVGCGTIPIDRSGFDDAAIYERLKPYYANDLAPAPRKHLRAVLMPISGIIPVEDGPDGHWHGDRPDIEVFFAPSVLDRSERITHAKLAIRTTCPDTDLSSIEDSLVFSSPVYLVFQNMSCLGHSRD